MGATQFRTPRANWDKRCCSNSRGPVVPIPQDLSDQDANKIDKQIARMSQGDMHKVTLPIIQNSTRYFWVKHLKAGQREGFISFLNFPALFNAVKLAERFLSHCFDFKQWRHE